MFVALLALWAVVLPSVWCSGEGNLHLLETEVAEAIKACAFPDTKYKRAIDSENNRSTIDRIDSDSNQYGHERRNTSDVLTQVYLLNGTDFDGYIGNLSEFFNSSTTARPRKKRNDPLVTRPDSDQCLSQCIFANLQVVDSRGIPREAELWNKVQASVTSQQSRGALKDQIRACFQELQSEAEDDGCSYSNKLEHCLMLRFSDRKMTSDHQKND